MRKESWFAEGVFRHTLLPGRSSLQPLTCQPLTREILQ